MAEKTDSEKIAELAADPAKLDRAYQAATKTQFGRADLAAMSDRERVQALKDGRLKDLLTGKAEGSTQYGY